MMNEENKIPAPPRNKISKDMAEIEFQRFVDSMDLDIDETTMNDEDKDSFLIQKRKLISAIEKGYLVINENGEAVYTPQKSDVGSLTFHERTGASILAMDGKKKNQDIAKMYAVMADMCKVSAKTFANLKGVDIKTCEAIFALLMA